MILLKMNRVIIDSNVFLSGLLFGGNPEKILEYWSLGKFILCISPELQAEIINKLQNKFHINNDSIKLLIEKFNNHSKKFIPQTKVILSRDPLDNFILELAEESHANFIITGDKDLLILEHYKKTRIVSPVDFLKNIT
ncbi:MAG: putative toxin-antitoxin system toxin component, PIN family [Patescibacteria group bacterium]